MAAPTPIPPHSQAAADVRRRVCGPFAGLTGLLLASDLLPLPGTDGRIAHLPTVCPFYHLIGLPCPGCGLTRAFVCLGHGHWHESLHWHPLGWLVYGVCLVLWLNALVTLTGGKQFLTLSPRVGGQLSVAGAAALLLAGVARIVWLMVSHQSF